MRLITWNINSVRLRAPLVLRLIEEQDPDVICLQETKTPDEHFPFDTFKEAGYEHIHAHGMKGYNGVAIISRLPFDGHDIHHRVGREDCRHISVIVKRSSCAKAQDLGDRRVDPAVKPQDDGVVEIHNLYIPAGGDEPDPDVNDKFAHKLDFVDEMTRWFTDQYTRDQPVIAVGDFNIAPYEHDVWSHKQLLKVVSHTPPETERLDKMLKSLDWIDVAREFVPMNEKCYTWWSYRNRDWRKSNRGRRLDHVWVTPPLKNGLKSYAVMEDARDWEKPSDHVPVVVEINT